MMSPGSYDMAADSFRFQCADHCWTVLKGLQSMRNKQLLFDITLIAQGREFQAHKVVLASCSEYFRAMFTDPMLEKHQDVIHLNGVSPIGLDLLLDYAYTSRLDLDHSNVQYVLGTASHLQIQPLVEACSRYLEHHLDIENCVDILNIADTYSLLDLREIVYCFIGQRLDKLACMIDFQNISADQLIHFLKCNIPINCPEHEVLQAVLCWLHFDLPKRVSQAKEILNCISFSDVKRSELRKILKLSVCKEISQTFPHIPRMLRSKVYQCCKGTPGAVEKDTSCLVNPRGFEKAIVNAGGFQAHKGLTNELSYLHLSCGKWRKLTSIPHVEQCDFGIAVLNNELYVVGGCFNQSLQEHIHPFGFKYDPREDKWSTIAPMSQERCRFYLGAAHGCLYALGGIGEPESVMDVSCEKYDPKTDFWWPIAALPSIRMQHAGAVSGNNIYTSGGLDMMDLTYNELALYNVTQDTWELKSPMLLPRADHCMTYYKDRLFVAGGWYEDFNSGNRVILDTVDVYSCLTDQWEKLTLLPTPRYHTSLTVLNDKLYIVGGFGAGQYNRASRKIETFNLLRNRWEDQEEYPVEIWEHVSCVLYVPLCRPDKGKITEFDGY